MHVLGAESTEAYEDARDKVAAFVGAPDRDEVVFTKNASEALNLVAYAFGNPIGTDPASGSARATRSSSPRWSTTPTSCRGRCSRSVPARQLRWFSVTDSGRLDLSNLGELVNERTRIVSIAHQSNVLGTVNPVAPVLARVREVGALMMLDASQSVPPPEGGRGRAGRRLPRLHRPQGPRPVGDRRAVWPAGELLEAMPPFMGGGEMIEAVWMDHSTYAPAPHKFEAGTPPIVEAIGLGVPRSTTCPRSGWTPSCATSASSPRTRSTPWGRSRGCGGDRPASTSPTGAARSRSRSRGFTRTTSGRFWMTTSGVWPCAWGTTAPARST
ncbi:hypothetical protein GCM10018952_43340 [Streptosporangium vulgare]